ncbi:MAG: pyruvate dehydrogenase (acetyl-transferring) E1 component subunit alpha [Candidatus Wildermuthbacteria bacterium RIFCSPHIGHO2_01_FULL_47_27]|uniref:Pyruvate dehydrogenase E1 component subunit alpha n=2 Tax=Candidatus Wildermuthiibacteriota TaxID=1817923 RepID=A0A1G2RTF3_9BACT|nr:MAG: pyruvate dehydrogenase (acetyl-transferring) E1 component subunit alpha [Candidatus Wildermuthbacteria bacterium RIFCSPHIGHO2_01_FULL_47_27]OHA68385.1 MAG: pyruvate dehydrogenase (acetyl-transferring) E1 component subunit alpha [Candidatus Wildermuthbacteria bacterium RIFCSPHIGHO2_02_FULL_47_17]OHA75572.1 MAG: pyruvate dehydrogenase (acetyl-transferring) E1 component subunit alpha [Candidatus Wildermuthbacteria bacterium RIFCSPLOWO2_01_FULL_48_35]
MLMLQFLDAEGKITNKKGLPKLSDKDLLRIYELMVLARGFDDMAVKLQREGRILTYASLLGQEAAQVASAYAIAEEDWFVTGYRDHGVWIARGLAMENLYMYWAGDERGMRFPENSSPEKLKGLPPAIPIASHIPHAVGLAWAEKMKGTKNAAVAYFGDGATSKGDFHEAMNFAGVFKIPCVFLCQNNQWAISVPRSRQTASATIAQKAQAYGFEGVLVDGNDVFAVYKATQDALQKARAGKGPTLIEAYTYRLENHTTADDWKRYRSEKEVEEWRKKDPVARLKKYMEKETIWSEKREKELQEKEKTQVLDAVKKFESVPPPAPEDIFKYLYAE